MKAAPPQFDMPELLRPLREQGWHWESSGEFVPGPTSITEDSPWISQNLDFDCYMWNRVFHKCAAKEQMVHTHCQNCFKIVVMPRTFRELIALEEYQSECGMRCKCGIEVRPYTSRAYGGYFYSWEPGELTPMAYEAEGGGLAGQYLVIDDAGAIRKGKLKYNRVFGAMAGINTEDIDLGIMPVILKRGCTEFEMHCGPTDQPRYRNITDEQVALEAQLDEVIGAPVNHFVDTQPEVIKDSIRLRWAEFAHSIGDMTYVPWLGHALSTPPVVYHK